MRESSGDAGEAHGSILSVPPTMPFSLEAARSRAPVVKRSATELKANKDGNQPRKRRTVVCEEWWSEYPVKTRITVAANPERTYCQAQFASMPGKWKLLVEISVAQRKRHEAAVRKIMETLGKRCSKDACLAVREKMLN